MARKLTTDESHLFDEIIGRAETAAVQIDCDVILQTLAEKRDRRIDLSPELGMWFVDDVTSLPR
jgi:hypothetical protein